MNSNRFRRSLLAAAATLLTLAPASAHAAWRVHLTPYGWATDVGAKADVNDRTVLDETISVNDLLEDLETIFQLKLEAMNGAHGVMIDVFDVTLADQVRGLALPRGAGTADLDSDIGMTLIDVAGVFDPAGDRQGLALLYGARIFNERATVDGTFQVGSTIEKTYETNETLVDGLLGMRFTKRFARVWSWQMQADVSTGGTDYTWSAGPTLGFAFGDRGRFGLTAGYRHMTLDFEDENGLDSQMTMAGPVVGFRTSF